MAVSEVPILPLRLLGETRFDHRVPDWMPKANPTVDLSVSWDASGKNLLIYRPPNQVVSKIYQYSRPGTVAPEPLAVSWKPDGRFLAVGWSDGLVRLMGLENNKTAHHIRVVSDGTSSKITHIGWARNTVGKQFLFSGKSSQPGSWPPVVSDEIDLPGKPAALDLPRELTFLEVDSSLPKISPLPPGSAGEGEDALVFTLRTGIEFLFPPLKTEDSDKVHVMVVGTSDGRLHLSIYDSFVIGDFRYVLPSSMYQPGVLQLAHHASHPATSTHSLLLRHPVDDDRAVYVVPMDLPFIPSSPINLGLLAFKLTTLQKLLRYVKQTQLHMVVEYKNTRELPARFVRVIQEDLEKSERGPTDIVQALFHTVVTGHAYDLIKEWLVDNVAERGHKRWDKAVTSGLENLRSLVHENLLPALERCSIILSRLRGLAQFHDTRGDIGFTMAQISRATDVVASLTLVAHRILLQSMEEIELFVSFSTWLRFQIDRLATSNTASEELTEKEAFMDNGKVLAYIQRCLTRSPMAPYLDDEVGRDEYDADWAAIEGGPPDPGLLDLLDAQLKRCDEGQPYMRALPQVGFLIDYLASRSGGLFKDIAEAQKKSVRFGQPTKIFVEEGIAKMDSMMGSSEAGENASTYTALTRKGKENEVVVFCTSMSIVNGISSATSNTVTSFKLDDDKVIDLKFLDDTTLVLLLSNTENKKLIAQISVKSPQIPYSPYQSTEPLPPPSRLSDLFPLSPSTLDFVVSCLSDNESPFVPVRMEVHGPANARGEIPPRVCLLGRDCATWRVFDLGRGDGGRDEEVETEAASEPGTAKGKGRSTEKAKLKNVDESTPGSGKGPT